MKKKGMKIASRSPIAILAAILILVAWHSHYRIVRVRGLWIAFEYCIVRLGGLWKVFVLREASTIGPNHGMTQKPNRLRDD